MSHCRRQNSHRFQSGMLGLADTNFSTYALGQRPLDTVWHVFRWLRRRFIYVSFKCSFLYETQRAREGGEREMNINICAHTPNLQYHNFLIMLVCSSALPPSNQAVLCEL